MSDDELVQPPQPPSYVYVHHINGVIVKVEFTNAPTVPDGAVTVVAGDDIGGAFAIGFKTHKVEGGSVVAMNAGELKAAQLPTRDEVVQAVFMELQATDYTQLADTKFTQEQRAAWAVYRQALRDLSQHTTMFDMIICWPTRPDGADPIQALRDRV